MKTEDEIVVVGVGGEKGGHVVRKESWWWAGRDRRMPVGRREQISSGGQTVAPTLYTRWRAFIRARARAEFLSPSHRVQDGVCSSADQPAAASLLSVVVAAVVVVLLLRKTSARGDDAAGERVRAAGAAVE